MTRKNKLENREDDYLLIRRVEQCSFVLLALLVLISWLLAGQRFACSALLGGLLSIGSFLLLKRTVFSIVSRIGGKKPTAGFAMKLYFRLLVLALLLAALSISITIHILALILGFSTVMVSIITVFLGRSLLEFSGNHAKGA